MSSSAPDDKLPVMAWDWSASIEIDGVRYRAQWLPSMVETWRRVLMVEGLPERDVDTFLAAAQEADSKPAWHVGGAPGEADTSVLARARERLNYDVEAYRFHFVSGYGEGSDGRLQPIGCAAVRSWITPDFESSYWIVVGRILLLPELRGRGVANALLSCILRISQTRAGPPAVGFVMESRSAQIRRLIQRATEDGLLDAVRLEPRRHAEEDDETVIGFYPGTRGWVLARAVAALAEPTLDAGVRALVEQVHSLWTGGGSTEACARIGAAFRPGEPALARAAELDPRLRPHLDFLRTIRAWGVLPRL